MPQAEPQPNRLSRGSKPKDAKAENGVTEGHLLQVLSTEMESTRTIVVQTFRHTKATEIVTCTSPGPELSARLRNSKNVQVKKYLPRTVRCRWSRFNTMRHHFCSFGCRLINHVTTFPARPTNSQLIEINSDHGFTNILRNLCQDLRVVEVR